MLFLVTAAAVADSAVPVGCGRNNRDPSRYGIDRTAKNLSLDYFSLKRRVEGEPVVTLVPQRSAVPVVPSVARVDKMSFLDPASAVQDGWRKCTPEVKDTKNGRNTDAVQHRLSGK